MHQTPFHCRILPILILLAATALPAGAQEHTPQENAPPKPAAREILPIIVPGQDQNDQQPQDPVTPDTSALTGAENFTLGAPEMRHSYWVPGFSIQNSAQSSQNGANNWIWASYLLGTLSARLASRHSELALNYSGGGSVSNSSTLPNSYYHELSFSQTFTWNRWKLVFLDQFSYLPQSSFGFGGVSGISTPGVGGSLGAAFPGLQNNYSPGQNLFSANVLRVNNSVVTEVDYSFTPRSSITVSGSYGILDFLQGNNLLGNNINTNDEIASLGYNYDMTRRDTIGVLYRFTGYQYVGTPQRLKDHTISLAYGRKITGRLALQVFGGPDVTMFSVPIGGVSERNSFSGSASLTYGLPRGSVSIKYSHGVSGGSGVLVGSNLDRVDTQFSRWLAGRWDTNVAVGFARNGALSSSLTGTSTPALLSLFVSAGLNRQLGNTTSFSLSYMFGHQNSSQAVCPTGGCGSNYMQHQIWVGFRWRARPMVIR